MERVLDLYTTGEINKKSPEEESKEVNRASSEIDDLFNNFSTLTKHLSAMSTFHLRN